MSAHPTTESSNMRNKPTWVTIALALSLGLVLSACGSKALETATQPPAVQATATLPLTIQPTATQPLATLPPTLQPTATQSPVVQATATQTAAVQATATQPPANTATVAPVAPDGATLLNDRCTLCHSLARVTSQHNSADQWTRIVSRMIQNGAQLTPTEQTILVDYLAKSYGP